MKVLALVAANRLPNNDSFYDALGELCQLEIMRLDTNNQKKLSSVLKKIDLQQYNKVVFDLHFKRLYKQARFIRRIPNLVIYELDACQNYIPSSKWQNKFLKFYSSLESFRLVCTGVALTEKLKQTGLDVHFLPKGYDHRLMKLTHVERDIELGFIGRTKSSTYRKREELLTSLQNTMGLSLLRTTPGQEYVETLNRIRFFVSADIGLTEYMAKNFEAMACGCILVAYRQGTEEQAQGLIDMENVVLYNDIDELREKIYLLQQNRELSQKIADNGYRLANKNHSFQMLAEHFYSYLRLEIKPITTSPGWKRWLFWH